MKSLMYISIFIYLFVACKENAVDVSTKPTTSIAQDSIVKPTSGPTLFSEFSYDQIKKMPIVEQGCLCSLGVKGAKNMYFVDNRNSLAVMKINDKFAELKAVIAEEVKESKVVKEYKNAEYRATFEGTRSALPKSDSGTTLSGTLTVYNNAGKVLLIQEVMGTCGC